MLRLTVKQAGAKSEVESIAVMHNSWQIGQMEGPGGDITISARILGKGPVAIYAKSTGKKPVVTAPIWLQIQ